jgi:hypothetical protein
VNIEYKLTPSSYGRHEVAALDEKGNVVVIDQFVVASVDGRRAGAKRLAAELTKKLGEPANAELIEAKLETAYLELHRREEEEQARKDAPPAAGPTADDLLDEMDHAVVKEAHQLLADPNFLRHVVDDAGLLGVAGEAELVCILYLIGTSRLQSRPVSARIHGPSSTGKTYIQNKVMGLMPPEGVVVATSLTPNSLYYMPPGALSHRVISAGERSRGQEDGENAEATKALREMQSTGRLSKMMPVKVDGRLETVLVEQEGPIAFLESTTTARVFDEDSNRCLPLATDETPEQTRRVIDKTSARYTTPEDPEAIRHATLRHHAVQRVLRQRPVVVPYAARLGELFADERVEARRAFPMVLQMLETSALLHGVNRKRDGNDATLADLNDYKLIRKLLSGPVARLLGVGITAAATRFHGRLHEWYGMMPFSMRDLYKREKSSRASVKGWLNELRNHGATDVVEEGRGQRPATWQLLTDKSPEACVLPDMENVSS